MVLPRRVHCLRAGRGSPVPRSKAPHDAVTVEGAAKPRFSEHRRRAEIASHPGKHVMPALTGRAADIGAPSFPKPGAWPVIFFLHERFALETMV